MTTQYGFFIDSARCTGCKTCELACKDYKNLTPEVSFRRIYEYAGATGRRTTASGSRTCLPITSPSPVTTVKIRPAPRSVRAARCISAKTVLWWSTKRYALAAATAIWPARTRPAVQRRQRPYDQVRWLSRARRRGEKPICVESSPAAAFGTFGPIAELRAKHGQLAR